MQITVGANARSMIVKDDLGVDLEYAIACDWIRGIPQLSLYIPMVKPAVIDVVDLTAFRVELVEFRSRARWVPVGR